MTREIQIGLSDGRLTRRTAALSITELRLSGLCDSLLWPSAILPFSVVRTVLALILAAVTALSTVLWLRALQLRAGAVMLTALILLTLSSYGVIEDSSRNKWIAGRISSRGVARRTGQGTALSLGSLLALALIKPK